MKQIEVFMTNANRHLGSTFDSFLEEEKIFEEIEAKAIKRVLAFELQKFMAKKGLTKMAMAKLMATSRPQLDRLLDPSNTSVTLNKMVRAWHVIGKSISLVDKPSQREITLNKEKNHLRKSAT